MSRNNSNYELYGDLLAGRAPDPIHVQSLREWSDRHGWNIRVHSPKRLAKIFLFRTPGVLFSVGEVTNVTTEPTVLVVHPGISQGFRFAKDVDGDVLNIRVDQVPRVPYKRFSPFKEPTAAIFPESETLCFKEIVGLFDQLGNASRRLEHQHQEIMAALVDLMMLYLTRDQSNRVAPLPARGPVRLGRNEIYAQKFCVLLEENFRLPWQVPEYAVHMGLSVSHLTRICRNVFESSPNSLLRRRRILEAKQLLEYTDFPISEVAHRSGFRDTAFFSRTFKSFVGVAPNAYRFSFDRPHR